MGVKPCKYCGGTGTSPDTTETGIEMRELRIKHGLTQRDLAKRMNVTVQYVCLMEKGKRNWTPKAIEKFRRATLAQ